MHNHDLTLLSGGQLARKIAVKELSPIEVTDAFLEKIERTRGELNAFCTVLSSQARAAARHAHDALINNEPVGALHGVPLVVKDLFHIQDEITTGGSMHWMTRRSNHTADAIVRLRQNGLIVLGKTQTVELGMGAFGTNQLMGTPHNPWNMTKHFAPGGSSSGSAVAVAAGLAPFSIGTDTGGSARIPAAWCGVVGLKLTYGRVSMYGVIPMSPTFDSIGLFARTVADLRLLYFALCAPRHPLIRAQTIGWSEWTTKLDPDLSGIRLLRLPEHERAAVEKSVLSAYDRALEMFGQLGATVLDVKNWKPLDYFRARIGAITMFEAASLYYELARDPSIPLDERVRARLVWGHTVSSGEYHESLRQMARDRTEFEVVFDEFDAIITPTTQYTACLVDDESGFAPPNFFTRFVNYLGLCAVSLPCGFNEDGLPYSVQIICKANCEELALKIASAFQEATPWHNFRPEGVSG